MKRKWRPFDQETLKKEFATIPHPDQRKLFFAMENYRDNTGIVYVVKNYGDGLMMIKDRSKGSGRCLFFTVREVEGVEQLVMLIAYKKESDEVPAAVLSTARERMNDYAE